MRAEHFGRALCFAYFPFQMVPEGRGGRGRNGPELPTEPTALFVLYVVVVFQLIFTAGLGFLVGAQIVLATGFGRIVFAVAVSIFVFEPRFDGLLPLFVGGCVVGGGAVLLDVDVILQSGIPLEILVAVFGVLFVYPAAAVRSGLRRPDLLLVMKIILLVFVLNRLGSYFRDEASCCTPSSLISDACVQAALVLMFASRLGFTLQPPPWTILGAVTAGAALTVAFWDYVCIKLAFAPSVLHFGEFLLEILMLAVYDHCVHRMRKHRLLFSCAGTVALALAASVVSPNMSFLLLVAPCLYNGLVWFHPHVCVLLRDVEQSANRVFSPFMETHIG